MKHVLIFVVASAGVVELLGPAVPEPAAWALVLAGIAGAGFVGRRRTKQAIDTDD